MSAISGTGGSLSASNVPTINTALEPANIRNGDAAAKKAYQTGLAFEQVLVQQLTQELASTVSSSAGGSGEDSSDGGSNSNTGLMSGSDAASSMYSQLLPQALGSSIMSSGGTGIAEKLATALDPALLAPSKK